MTTNSTSDLTAIDTSAPTNVRWRIFMLMLMLIAINYVDRASISVAMPVISKEFNLDLTTQGFILSAFFLTYALMQIPGGLLADRFKPRAVIAAATLGWGFFQAVAAISFNAWVLVFTRLGLGASEAPISGGRQTERYLDDLQRTRTWSHAPRWRRTPRRGARLSHHRRFDRRIRLLAHFLRRGGGGHHAVRPPRLVVHP